LQFQFDPYFPEFSLRRRALQRTIKQQAVAPLHRLPSASAAENLGRTEILEMIDEDEPAYSAALAEAVVAAVERAELDELEFGLAELCNHIPALAELETRRLKAILLEAGCSCAKGLEATWVRVCPDDDAPLLALEATRAWLAEPSDDRALRSATFSGAALESFARTRGASPRASWPAHAWLARTCAWLADSPQYGWQAVAALVGLTKAGMREELVTELATQLRRGRQPNKTGVQNWG